MRIRLAVGVPRNAAYARTALDQSGIPVLPIDTIAEGLRNGVRVFVWNRPDPAFHAPDLPPCALLTDHAFLARLLGLPAGAEASSHSFTCSGAGPVAARGFFVQAPIVTTAPPTFGHCCDAGGQPIANSGLIVDADGSQLGAATARPAPGLRLTSWPWNLLDLHLGERWGDRPFYSSAVDKHFVQVGTWADSGALRRLLFELLIRAFHALGLPLVRLAPFPHGQRHFSIRIDADGYSPASTASVLRVAQRLGLRFTWFIDVHGWEPHLGAVADLLAANQDVQLHCYYHRTYRSKAENTANIRTALRRLARHAVHPHAIVSPCGHHFDGFRDAIRELGFRYSSEFGFATDDLPAHPLNDPSYPLQVPVHCGGLCEFKDAGFSPAEMFEHWESVAAETADQNGVAVLYEHPLNRLEHYEEEFAALLSRLPARGYEHLPMAEYAAAWTGRNVSREIWYHDGTIDLGAAGPCGAYDYEVFTDSARADVRCTRNVPHLASAPPICDQFRCPPPEMIAYAERRQRSLDGIRAASALDWYVRHYVRQFVPTGARTALRRLRGLSRPPPPST